MRCINSVICVILFCFSSRRRHTRCALVTGVQTCALPICRSHDRGKGRLPLHTVSAWAARQRLVLGQEATDAKSNEITAIPRLLERLELAGALVTIDAMGPQRSEAHSSELQQLMRLQYAVFRLNNTH